MKIKLLKSLQNKKSRAEHRLFFVEGIKIVNELFSSSYEVVEYYIASDFDQREILLKSNVEKSILSIDELSSIGSLVSNSSVSALVKIPTIQSKEESAVTLILDGINDPGNLGSIFRIADWYGIKKVICSMDTVDLYNPKVISASKGSFVRVNVDYKNLEEFMTNEKVKPAIGAFLHGENAQEFKFPEVFYLVIGNEANGIRKELLRFIDNKITIKRWGYAESLNAAVASAILLDNYRRSFPD